MKRNFTESLDSRLLKYSLAAGVVLTGVGSANATVVSNNTSGTLSSNGATFNVQFNGHTKFIIKMGTLGYGSGSLIPQSASAKFINVNSRTYVKALGTNSTINSGRSFVYNKNPGNFFGSAPTSFQGKGDKYIGVRFKDSSIKLSGLVYGYIKVNVASGGTSIKIYGDAYENSSNSIRTNTSLPVELTTFKANNLGDKVELQWHTATEVNNYGFDIERSQKTEVSSQNPQWLKIGFVKGNGNSNSPKNYSFIDDNPPSGNFEYRLKQIDNDGSFRYSNIVEASFMKPNKFELFQNYPNPFNPTTTIQYAIPKSEHVTIKVYDELGKEVSSLVNENKEAGQYRVNFNGSNLASGIYYYRIAAGDFSEVKKLMLLK